MFLDRSEGTEDGKNRKDKGQFSSFRNKLISEYFNIYSKISSFHPNILVAKFYVNLSMCFDEVSKFVCV